MYSPTRKKGNVAEDIVSQFLQNEDFVIVERNMLRKWGEIDIIASKSKKLYFIEVKSILQNNNNTLFHMKQDETWTFEVLSDSDSVSHETLIQFDPIWNMTTAKQRKFARAIRVYLAEMFQSNYPEFQIDIITVYLDYYAKIAYIKKVENVILVE